MKVIRENTEQQNQNRQKLFSKALNAVLCAAVVFLTVLCISRGSNRVEAQPAESTETAAYTPIEEELSSISEKHRDLLTVIGAYSVINSDNLKPDIENVKIVVDMCDFWFPEIILAQYKLESSEGTSRVAKTHNNLFGMKKAFSRPSVRCKSFDTRGYAVYNNWPLSVVDRRLWDDCMFPEGKPTREEYLAKLTKIYAEDAKYVPKLKRIEQEMNISL